MLAATQGRTDVALVLLRQGVDITLVDRVRVGAAMVGCAGASGTPTFQVRFRTALHLAAMEGHAAIVAALLQRHADINGLDQARARCRNGSTW